MVEKIIRNPEIVRIEREGKFNGMKKREFQKKMKIEELINRATSSKTFKGYFSGYLRVLRKQDKDAVITYKELVTLLEELFRKIGEYEKIGISKSRAWRGKSDLQILKSPDKLITIRWRKEDKDSEPTEDKVIIFKEELNNLILALKHWKIGDKISTRELTERYCRIAQIYHNHSKEELFKNGKFIYAHFFSDRGLHTHFNRMLQVMDSEKVTKYRGRISELINDKIGIQEILYG